MSYSENSKTGFKDLVESIRKSTSLEERKIQEYIESHPECILGGLSGVNSQYQIFGNLIISQPRFKSYCGDRLPDFLVVTWDSLNLYFNFIEIEDPSKKILGNKTMTLSNDFLQAYNQLMQWKSFDNEEIERYCAHLLQSLFKNNFNNLKNKTIHHSFSLIYGFGEEIEKAGLPYNNLIKNYFSSPDMVWCTYSRMIRDYYYTEPLITVKGQDFKAIGMVPFKNYGTEGFSCYSQVIEKEELIAAHPYLSDEKKIMLFEDIHLHDSKTRKEIHKMVMDSPGTDLFDRFDV